MRRSAVVLRIAQPGEAATALRAIANVERLRGAIAKARAQECAAPDLDRIIEIGRPVLAADVALVRCRICTCVDARATATRVRAAACLRLRPATAVAAARPDVAVLAVDLA